MVQHMTAKTLVIAWRDNKNMADSNRVKINCISEFIIAVSKTAEKLCGRILYSVSHSFKKWQITMTYIGTN